MLSLIGPQTQTTTEKREVVTKTITARSGSGEEDQGRLIRRNEEEGSEEAGRWLGAMHFSLANRLIE